MTAACQHCRELIGGYVLDGLEPAEREQVRKLLVKSRGRPNRLSRDEARTLGRLAGRAASSAAATRRLKR